MHEAVSRNGRTRSYPRRRAGVATRGVEGEIVLLDRRRHLVHQLNQTASYIWRRCDGYHTVAEIARELARDFDIDAETATPDVATAVRHLQTLGLVQSKARARARADRGS